MFYGFSKSFRFSRQVNTLIHCVVKNKIGGLFVISSSTPNELFPYTPESLMYENNTFLNILNGPKDHLRLCTNKPGSETLSRFDEGQTTTTGKNRSLVLYQFRTSRPRPASVHSRPLPWSWGERSGVKESSIDVNL